MNETALNLSAKLKCLVPIALFVALAGRAGAAEPGAFEQALRYRKTLLSWNTSVEPREDDDNRLVTDRPHISEASSLVGLGRVQLETGYSYFRDANAGTISQIHSFPEPLLRAGLFAEWFEFRLGYNYLVQSSRSPDIAPSLLGGSDDLYLGAKLALTEQQGWFPEVAFFPQTRIPTGSIGVTAGQMLPGFNLAYSWVMTELLELECNTQLNRRQDQTGAFYTEFFQTVNLEYDFAQWIAGFTELLFFVPNGAVSQLPQQYFHAGLQIFFGDNIQFDIHSAVGLNRAADNLAFTGVGLSMRY